MSKQASIVLSVVAGISLFSNPVQSAPLSHLQTFVNNAPGSEHFHFTYDSVSTVDNRFVYSIAGVDDAINIMQRNPGSKLLSVIDTVLGNEDTGEGTHRPQDILMSSDERHIYVLGGSPEDTDNSIFVFERNADTGALVEVQEYSQRGLASPARFTMSDDGQFLYVASLNSHSVTVLQRAANGTLRETQFITDVEPEFPSGYDYPTSVIISPDQNHLYVGMWVSSSSSNGVIAHYQRDTTTGALSYVDQADFTQDGLGGLNQPTDLVISPDGRHLYATCTSNSEIFEFQITPTGSLSFSGTANVDTPDADMDRLIWVNNLQFSNNGHLAYATDTILDTLILFHRDVDSGELHYAGAEAHGQDGVVELRQNERVILSPDSRFAYVGSAGRFAVFDLTLDLDLATETRVLSNGTTTVEATITNQGPVAAHHLQFQFQVDSGVLIDDADPFSLSTQCSVVDTLATCHLDSLNASASEIITLSVSSDSAGPYIVTSSVSSDEIDEQLANNVVEDSITFGDDSTGDDSDDDRSSDDDTTSDDNSGQSSGSSSSGGGSLNLGLMPVLAGLGWFRKRAQHRN